MAEIMAAEPVWYSFVLRKSHLTAFAILLFILIVGEMTF